MRQGEGTTELKSIRVVNPTSFMSLQFSQALAIRSYTKFVMGVSPAYCL